MNKETLSVIVLGEFSTQAQKIILNSAGIMGMNMTAWFTRPKLDEIVRATFCSIMMCSPEIFKDYEDFLTKCSRETKILVATEKDEIDFVLPDSISLVFVDKRIHGLIGRLPR